MVIFILFTGHFLADFTFQSENLVQNKLNNFKYFIYHALIYASIFLIATFPFVKFEKAIFTYLVIISSHFLIDWIRKYIDEKNRNRAITFATFLIDQVFHLLIIIILYYAFCLDVETTKLYYLLQQTKYFDNIAIYCLLFTILWDPAAVFIKKLFTYIFDGDSCIHDEDDPQVGRIIGKLERVIISTLILNKQIGAIGFVLTAKSIARYKQLEDKRFAEKYLIGTLTSVLIAFVVTIALKQFLK